MNQEQFLLFLQQSTVVSWVGLALTGASLVFGWWQWREVQKRKREDYHHFWELAKCAHMSLGRIERLKTEVKKAGVAMPEEVAEAYGSAHTGAADLVRRALLNALLQSGRIDEAKIEYWKEKKLLTGYLLEAFDQMRLEPPEAWRRKLKETMQLTA